MKTSENQKENSQKTLYKKGVVIAASIGATLCISAGIIMLALPEKTNNFTKGIVFKFKTKSSLSRASQKNQLLLVQESDISKALKKPVINPEPVRKEITKRTYSPYSAPFSVKGGPVHLGRNRHPSAEKIALGKAMGMDFEELGITWRNDYMKGVA